MKRLSQINVIPFIDIMLVLLAVVLTTATFVAQGRIPITTPHAAHADPVESGEALELAIDADGVLYLRDQMLSLQQIDAALDDYPLNTRVVLHVDAAVAFQHFVALIDVVKGHGIQDLSILTQRRAE